MKKNFKEKDDFIFLNKERVRLTMLVTTIIWNARLILH